MSIVHYFFMKYYLTFLMYDKLLIEVKYMSSNLVEFLTSKEIIVIYIFAIVACILCIIIYLVEKNNRKARLRHNTRELNKLVEEIQEEYPEENHQVIYEEPVLETIEDQKEVCNVEELLESTMEIEKIKMSTMNQDDYEEIEEEKESYEEPVIIENIDDIVYEVEEEVEPIQVEEEQLEYTTIEPDQATAQLELKKLTEELQKQEEVELNHQEVISNYEEMQEETAIISLDELVKRSKEIYEANEVTQYQDEGNEPISLQELKEKTGSYSFVADGVFDLNEVVPKEEESPVVIASEEVPTTNDNKVVTLYDFHTAPYEPVKTDEVKKFKSSPIISPIYGIEKDDNNGLQVENTADYEKLDAEIKKTNEFLMTLRELQQNIDS